MDGVGKLNGFPDVVGDDDGRARFLVEDAREPVAHVCPSEGVESSKGFIKQDHASRGEHRTSESNTGTHSSGQFIGPVGGK